MADTVRYRASSRVVYAHALIALVALARTFEGPEFSFGPMDIQSLTEHGLTVSGDDLTQVTDSLSRVAGLSEVPA